MRIYNYCKTKNDRPTFVDYVLGQYKSERSHHRMEFQGIVMHMTPAYEINS